MENSLKFAAKAVKFARKHGLKGLKLDGIEFEFFSPTQSSKPMPFTINGEPIPDDEKMPTDDEMLHWSTPAFDLIRAQRKAAKEAS